MADNIKDLTLETPTDEVKTDEVKTDEVKTDEIETVSKETVEVEETAKTGLLGATANSTGDVPATSFTTKTAPDGTDNLILFNQNTNVGYQIDYDNLADAILNKITSKTFSNQVGGSSAATLLSQLATLNSKIPPQTGTTISPTYNETLFTPSSRYVKKYGSIVVVNIQMNVIATATYTDTIASGLPAPADPVRYYFYRSNQPDQYKIILDENGTIKFDYGAVPSVGNTLSTYFVYIARAD